MKKLLLLALCGLSSQLTQAQLCLSPATNYGTGATPNVVCYADFNNDGKKDLATANWSPNNVSVLLGDGLGGFAAATTFTAGNGCQSVCSADFNADGNADLAVTLAFSGTNKVAILLGTGSGTFGSATTFTVPAGPISICTGDFNSDGKADLATCNNTANNVSVAMGNGNGTFVPVVNYITMSAGPYQIIAADFNGDSKLDLATANNSGNNVSVYLNNGSGSFSMGTIYGTGTGAYSLCAADFNSDSFLDIAVTFFNDGAVVILPNSGTGTFYGTQTSFTVGTNPVAICSGDFDGDLKQDVAVTNYNSTPQLFVMLGDGAANLGAGTGYNVGTNPYFVLTADLDANGKKDIVTSNYNSANVSVLLNGAPTASISGSLSICSGNSTNLSGTTAQTYSWSSGGTGQSEFVMPGVGTTTYTLTEANGICTATTVATVTVTATPTLNISGSLNICSGGSTILTAGTAAGYTWTPGGANTNTLSVNPTSNTGYTVTGANGICTVNTTVTVNVTATPTVIISGIMAICSGQNTTLIGSSAGSYTWSSGGLSQTEMVSPTTTTDYTLTEANGTCTGSSVATVTVSATPSVTISGATDLCFGKNTVITASGATTFTWSSGGVTTNTLNINPTTNTVYTVSGGNPLVGGTGNCISTATTSINILMPPTPNICMVSTDSMSTNNILFWEKTGMTNVDSFVVYREVSTGIYKRIGAVSIDSLSMFVDTTRSVGPANGDPNIGFYRYKLQTLDTCGNYSPLSLYHTSVYFVDNHTGTFSWNTYDVEGQPTPVANFILRRDNANTGVYVVVGTVSGNTTILNDPSYATFQTIANWRVDASGFNCTPTMRYGNNGTQAAIIKSKSNISNNRTTSVKKTETSFNVYPNPTNGNFTINFSNSTNGKVNVKVVSVLGTEAYNETFTQSTEKVSVDLSKYENGIYLVQITTNNSTVVKRIVKQ